MANTKIEWANKVWNPVTGCTPVSAGCANCYAKAMHKRLEHIKGSGYLDGKKHFSVRLHPDRLNEPLKWKKPQRIFVCSMGDLFHEDVPSLFVDRVRATIRNSRQHLFLMLTKRPASMCDYFSPMGALYNLHVGVSVEDQPTTDERMLLFLQTPAVKRFVSYEPALGPVDFSPYLSRLDWVIMGGESGPGARPMHPDWARSVRDQCKAAGVPFFLKQNGEWLLSLDVPSGYADTYSSKTRGSRNLSKIVGRELMVRVGKKAAGCLLDGVEYKEVLPEMC